MRSYVWLVALFIVAWADDASAGWYYKWSCNGNCAAGQLSIGDTEGPYGTEEECESAKANDQEHKDLLIEPGNFGVFEGCWEEGGSSGGSSSPSSYSSYGRRGGGGAPEVRLLAGARWPIFDSGIKTDKMMAGQPADAISANGQIEPGVAIILQLDQPQWSGVFAEIAYARNNIQSMGTKLGHLGGGWLMFGYERGTLIAKSRCGAQMQFGFGGRVTRFTVSDAVTELENGDVDMTTLSYYAAVRLGLSCRLTEGGTWLDLATGAYYTPMEFTETIQDISGPQTEILLRTSASGLVGGIGLTFVL